MEGAGGPLPATWTAPNIPAGRAQQLCDIPAGPALLALTTCAKHVIGALGTLRPMWERTY